MPDREFQDWLHSRQYSKEELELIKLRIEVKMLQDQLDSQVSEKKFSARFTRYFQKNIGQWLVFFGLVVGFFSPIFNYIGSIKQERAIRVSNDLFKLLGDSAKADPELKEKISTEDPTLVAGYILDRMNDHEIRYNLASEIYVRMIKLNREIYHSSFSDKMASWFVANNQKVLENELKDHATTVFHQSYSNEADLADRKKLIEAYIDIIYGAHLQNKKDFAALIHFLQQQCPSSSEIVSQICEYLKTSK
jgi:hypothetical protein